MPNRADKMLSVLKDGRTVVREHEPDSGRAGCTSGNDVYRLVLDEASVPSIAPIGMAAQSIAPAEWQSATEASSSTSPDGRLDEATSGAGLAVASSSASSISVSPSPKQRATAIPQSGATENRGGDVLTLFGDAA